MLARGHLAQGILFGTTLVPVIPPVDHSWSSVILFVGTSALGSLVPDLDLPRSTLTRAGGPLTGILHRVLMVLTRTIYQWTRGPHDLPVGNGHRTLSHTPLFTFFLGAALYFGLEMGGGHSYAFTASAGLVIGCLAHLFGDSCTHEGVPLLWPIKIRGKRWKRRGIPASLRFTTGGPLGEPLMTWVSIALCVVVPLWYWGKYLFLSS